MKKVYILLLLLSIGILSNAQVPGYMGKRIMISGGILIGSPNSGNVSSTYANPNYSGFFLHKYYRLSADVVISQKKSVCLSVNQGSMGYNNYSYNYQDNIITNLDVKSLDIGIKYHLKGNIAPFGRYLIYGVSFHSATNSDPDKKYSYAGYSFPESKTTFQSVFFGLGTNYVLKDIIVLSASIETNLGYAGSDYYERYYIIKRWERSAYLNLGFGIGVIL
jgi:hypothetical protein